MLVKFSPPTHHDKEPKDTLCYVIINDDIQAVYKQIGDDKDNPQWALHEYKTDLVTSQVSFD